MTPRKCTAEHKKFSLLVNLSFILLAAVLVTLVFPGNIFLLISSLIVSIPVAAANYHKNIKDRILLKFRDIDEVFPTLFRHAPGDTIKEDTFRYRFAGIVDNEFVAYTEYDLDEESEFVKIHAAEYMRKWRNISLEKRIQREETAVVGRKIQENPKNDSHMNRREARQEIPITHRLQS